MAASSARLLRTSAGALLRSPLVQPARHASISCKRLEFERYGDPVETIKLVEYQLEDTVAGKDVLVEMLAVPLNPADVTTVQGTYAVRPESLPAVVGNEGVGRVLAVGPDVQHIEVGDMVIPFLNLLGTCRSHGCFPQEDLIKIRKSVPLVEAATLSVNPCTAYRMLHDFVRLDDDDVVLQNGANSAVGQTVIQLCRCLGFRSVNVVRARDNLDALKRHLTKLGATEVLTEEELRTTDLFKSGRLAYPKLALNCVGGASATELVRHLDIGGTLVTYGGMSRLPLTLPTAAIIFRDIRACGFWMTRWTNAHQMARARWEMLDQLQSMSEQRLLLAPRHKFVHIDNWKRAVTDAMPRNGRADYKPIIVFDKSLSRQHSWELEREPPRPTIEYVRGGAGLR